MRQLEKSLKGEKLERELSLKIHKRGVPVLISSLFLRRYHASQVDLCLYQKNAFIIYEVKSSDIGIFKSQRNQRLRLYNSLTLLQEVTKRPVYLKYIKKDFESLTKVL